MKHDYNNYFGHEGQTVEFKTSFIFPANGCKDDQRFVVFKAVNAMLNTDGGEVFIGINDNTEKPVIGQYYGVNGDRQRLHLKNNDEYTRYIRNRIDDFFCDPKYVRGLVSVEQTDNENVVVIAVKKADKVVYMHRCGNNQQLAFRREGAASNEMDHGMIKQRERSLREEKAKANTPACKEDEFRTIIMKAIEKKCKVCLFGYSSSNSDTMEDRIIEPISLICGERSVWAYECREDKEDHHRQFRLNRVENVKLLDEIWEHEAFHKKAHIDAFEWSRATEPTILINIVLGPSARNSLVENSPESIKYMDKTGKGTWNLNTKVHSLEPVKRFCMEFKDSIHVNVPEELKVQLGLVDEPAEKKESKPVPQPVHGVREFLKVVKCALGWGNSKNTSVAAY